VKIDCHTHLVVPTRGPRGYLSGWLARSPSFVVMKVALGLSGIKDPEAAYQLYLEQLANLVRTSELDRAVLLAFDEVYKPSGERDEKHTRFYVSNDAVIDAATAFPEAFLIGASVHPSREDACDELDRVADSGAVLVKLLPNSHGFDPMDARYTAYYRKLRQRRLALLVHAGYEHTIPAMDQRLGMPERLRRPLDEGATVIVAHCGSSGRLHTIETFPQTMALLRDYPNCWADSSALGNFWRSQYLEALLDPELMERRHGLRLDDPFAKIVHGSDYPIPLTPWSLRRALGRADRKAIAAVENPLQKDIEIKRRAGVPEDCLGRFARLAGIEREEDVASA
jgi:predicted TIM-barrel fold metal-dependent hydrolase